MRFLLSGLALRLPDQGALRASVERLGVPALHSHSFTTTMLRSLLLALCLTATLTACDSGGDAPGGNGIMTASIDGDSYNASFGNVLRNSGSLLIIGVEGPQTASQRSFSLIMPDAVGTYTSDIAIAYIEGPGDGAMTWGAVEGSATITVTSITAARVTGTFSGSLVGDGDGPTTSTRTVTDGRFDIQNRTSAP